MNANDAELTDLNTTQTGSSVADNSPNAPAKGSFDLVLTGVAGSVIGNGGGPYKLTVSAIDLTAVNQPWAAQTLAETFDTADNWKLSGTGPDYEYTHTFSVPVPGGPSGPLAGHTLQYVASLVSQGAQIVSIIRSEPFVLV